MIYESHDYTKSSIYLKENQKHLLKLMKCIKPEWTVNRFGIVMRHLSFVITVHNSDGSRLPQVEYFQIRELAHDIWDLEESVKMPDIIRSIRFYSIRLIEMEH